MANTAKNDSGMLTGLFRDRDSAERAYQGLSDRGYSKDDVNLIMSDETRKRHFGEEGTTTELGSKAAEGAGVGGAIGGGLGAVLAAIAATGTSIAIPGLGLVIAGPLAAALAGAGAGAATGGLVGALIGSGIPEERVKRYDEGIKNGGILMGVNPRSDDDASYIENHWRTSQGEDIYRPMGTSQTTGTQTTGAQAVSSDLDRDKSSYAQERAGVTSGQPDTTSDQWTYTNQDAIGASSTFDKDYRTHWQQTYGTSGERYEDYDSAYRYGSSLADNDRYKNSQWDEVEPQVRQDWESRHPGSAWEKVKDAVRYGVERISNRRSS